MKKLVLVLLAVSAMSVSAFASEQSAQNAASNQSVQATCYATGMYGEPFYWTHFNPYIARNNVMAACVQATGNPCFFNGCSAY